MEPFTFFISYRRRDTAPIALLLKYEMEKRLQFIRVFVDVDKIEVGALFPERIQQLIDKSHATIALIGTGWMPKITEKIDDSHFGKSNPDYVEIEISSSIERPLIYDEDSSYDLKRRKIIPLFVDIDQRFDAFQIPKSIIDISSYQGVRINHSDWPRAIGPLIDDLATQLKLKKRPDSDEYPNPDLGKARTQPLPDVELIKILNYDDFDGWYLDNFGNSEVRYLAKTFKFKNFEQASNFMQLVSNHVNVLDHHPEWRNVFNHVTVSLTTWDAKRRVTIYDLNLALFMNQAARYIRSNKQYT